MNIILLISIAMHSTDQTYAWVIGTSLPLVMYMLLKKKRKKMGFIGRFLMKKFSKKINTKTRGGRILLGLLLSIIAGGLIGLLAGWTIGLYVAAGLAILIFIYFLLGEKGPGSLPY